MRLIICALLLIQFYHKEGCAYNLDDDYEEKYVRRSTENSSNEEYKDSDELFVRHTTRRSSEEHYKDSEELYVRHTTEILKNNDNENVPFDEFFDSHSDERYGKEDPSSSERGFTKEHPKDYCDWEYKMDVIKLFKKFNKSEIDEENYIDMKHDVHLLDRPDIGNASIVPRGSHFSIFVRKHNRAMLDLVHYFIKANTTCDLWEMAHRVKPLVNEKLFAFALSNVISVKDFGLDFPAVFETDPIDFIPSKFVKAIDKKHHQVHDVINKMRNETRDKRQLGNRPTITWRQLQRGVYEVNSIADLTASSRDVEFRTGYFRDDYGVNSHHYNWHLVHLDDSSRSAWQVRVPRRMEFFMYVHQQMLARYNFERLSSRLPVVVSWGDNIREPIAEGHIPNLGHDSDEYATRPPNMTPRNGNVFRRVENLRRQIDNGMSRRMIDDEMFLQTLELYHNDGHLLISQTHYEGGQGGQPRVGVMFESQTSMRDPVFYRYHQHIEDMWLRYQDMKTSQGQGLISYQDLEEIDLAIRFVDVSSAMSTRRSGEVVTGCNIFALEATNGFDFDGNEEVYVRLTHLDHVPFTYHLGIENRGRGRIQGMVRIFMAPQFNERGQEMDFEEQRKKWIEMDKFIHVFSPGRNSINRGSNQSTVAVNCRNTFRDVTERITHAHGQLTDDGHCGCGWPQHMILPRGWDGEGMPVQIFVMVTNENHIDHRRQPSRSTYCGVPGVRQADQKPMGYPFHYRAPRGTRSIRDYHDRLPNAYVNNIRIRFSGKQVDPSKPDSRDCPHM